MKRWILAVTIVSLLGMGTGVARAAHSMSDEYDDSMMHPLRLAYYVLHPIGFAAEWLIGRPFHYIVSRPYLDQIFGYTRGGAESGRYGSTR